MAVYKHIFTSVESGTGFVLSAGLLTLEDCNSYEHGSSSDALRAFSKGLTQWIKETSIGAQANKQCQVGISISDVEDLSDEALRSLAPYLESYGVRLVSVDIFGEEAISDFEMCL